MVKLGHVMCNHWLHADEGVGKGSKEVVIRETRGEQRERSGISTRLDGKAYIRAPEGFFGSIFYEKAEGGGYGE